MPPFYCSFSPLAAVNLRLSFTVSRSGTATIVKARYLILPALLPLQALAQTSPPSTAGSLLQMLLGLGVTIALLVGALTLLKRLQGSRASQAGALRVISATSVGPRERVVLVAVGKQVLVVGVAPGRVNALHTLSIDDLPVSPEPVQAPLPGGDFARRLRQVVERYREK